MPVAPLRGLAERGLVLDAPPVELAGTAFSNGSNVRFADGAVRRGSVLRTVRTPVLPEPNTGQIVVGFAQSSGYDRIFIGSNDGRIREVASDSTITDRHVTPHTVITDERQWTADVLGDVLYMNKPTHVPSYFPGGAATSFTSLPGWDATHRAGAMAASRDQLFAVNIVKGVVSFPNTVKISDYALYGGPPSTWDPLAIGAVANEITLAGARTPLVGCLDLDGVMIVYAERQAWRFTFTGDTSNSAQNLWVNEPLSLDRGMIAPNAAIYHERKHYVFGTDDIWVHDGVSVGSIADGKVRRWLFRNLDAAKADRCFATFDANTDEAIFAFVSKDADAVFTATRGCNRALVYQIRRGTWTLIDLPDVTSAGASNFNPTLIWSAATATWATMGGSWADLGDGYARSSMFLTSFGTPQRVLALDEANTGRVSFPAALDANAPAFVERSGFDLDELGAGLSPVKIISTILPQITVLVSNTTVRFRVGASMFPQGPYTWGDWKTFDPTNDYRVDFNKGGRYLGIRLEMLPPTDFEWTGMDVDLRPGGRR